MTSTGIAWHAWGTRGVAVASLFLVSAFGLGMRGDVRHEPDPNRRDCPHDWKGHDKPVSGGTITEIAVAPLISEIPEFHDCQKLIDPTATKYVDAPIAIFAHQTLLGQFRTLVRRWTRPAATPTWTPRTPAQGPGLLVDGQPIPQVVLDSTELPPPANAAGDAFVFAEILNYGSEYQPLGIKPGFNCLFVALNKTGGLRAAMVSVQDDGACLRAAIFDTLLSRSGAKRLVVRPTAVGFPQGDYPPVARWDWDATNKEHYIGIMCGPAWCEVGDNAFVSSPQYTGGPKRAIKGWYDQQRLAMTTDPNGDLAPSSIIGTVFPNPSLGASNANANSYSQTWVSVATIAVSHSSDEYKHKLNLDPSPASTPSNLIELCSGTTRAHCAPKIKVKLPTGLVVPMSAVWRLPVCTAGEDGTIWWARIRGANGGALAYRCVNKWDAPADALNAGFRIPATARWRWLKTDETVWQACIAGCCEVET